MRDGVAVWTRTEIVDAERAGVVAAMKDGMSIRDAAKESGCNPPPITAPKSTFKWMVA